MNIDTIETENEDEETYLRYWFTGLQVHGRENATMSQYLPQRRDVPWVCFDSSIGENRIQENDRAISLSDMMTRKSSETIVSTKKKDDEEEWAPHDLQ